MPSRLPLVTTLAALALANTALACCMVPRDFRGRIGQRAQEAVIIHHDGREELIVGIDYRITGPETMPDTMPDTMPAQFAWVITVPAEPDAYAVADRALFKDMGGALAARLLAPPPPRRRFWQRGAEDAAAGGVELGRRVQVGPYDIQPVRGVGADALSGLNAWLETNGFPTEDPAHMKYFVDEGFTFLCIRVQPEAGKGAVERSGEIPALQLSFATDEIYYPLRFSSRQGVFDVRLHVLTTAPLDYRGNRGMLKRLRWSNDKYKRNLALSPEQVPDRLAAVYEQGLAKAPAGATWLYNYIEGQDVNKDDAIAKWADDVFLASMTKDR